MSKPQESKETIFALSVPVTPEAVAYLEANRGDKSAADKMSSYVAWLFDRLVRGGLMIEPTDMDYLAGLNKDKRFETSRDVVKAVEIALKREDGQFSFTLKIDPAMVETVNDNARYNGMTTQEFLQMGMNEVISNGWYGELVPQNGRLVQLDERGLKTCQRVLGKMSFDSNDVLAALERLEKLEAKQPKPVAA